MTYHHHSFLSKLGLTLLTVFATTSLHSSAMATERISVRYGQLGRSVSVSSLEAFAEDGIINDDLRGYLRRVSPETRTEIQRALSASRKVDPVAFSQLLQTPIGSLMLEYAGQVIQTGSRHNGAQAIRGALNLAANDPEGISLIGFLKAFPTSEMRFDLGRARILYREATNTITNIDGFLADVKQLAEAEAQASPIRVDSIPSLGEKGSFPVVWQILNLQDPTRNRDYPVHLYYPKNFASIEDGVPVLVFSHGLGSSPEFFAGPAEYLASHGFMVALPQHIGSDKAHQDAVRKWLAKDLFKVSEFVDRPQDVSFLLDELERLNPNEFQGTLNLEQVGVAGHSFGGYTALALAGATVDFDRIRRLCQLDTAVDVGMALLLTCRALELHETSPESVQALSQGDYQDERVSMVAAIHPVSHLFGQSGMSRIQVPVMMVGGSEDIAAPLLREQAEPFTWLTTPEKYLIVAERVSHNEELTTLINGSLYAVEESTTNLKLAREEYEHHIRALALIFAQVHLVKNEAFQPYLSAAYVEAVSQAPFSLNMVQALPADVVVPRTLDDN